MRPWGKSQVETRIADGQMTSYASQIDSQRRALASLRAAARVSKPMLITMTTITPCAAGAGRTPTI